MANETLPPNQRRFFLTLMLSGVGAALAAAGGWSVLRFLSPPESDSGNQSIEILRDQVDIGGAHFLTYQGRPAVVLQQTAGEFTAFSAVCTHLGCIVTWRPEAGEFLCPCHAGRFSSTGAVLSGPPPKPLEALPVTIDGDRVRIG